MTSFSNLFDRGRRTLGGLRPGGLQLQAAQTREALDELSALRADPIFAGDGVPRGRGEPVVVIGGFGAPGRLMRPLASWLSRIGHRTTTVCHRHGLDCSEPSSDAVARAVEDAARRHRRPVHLVAHSRGGQFARVVAARRPELVAGLVTLGTPFVAGLPALAPRVRVQIVALGAAGSAGVRGVVRVACASGKCCARFWRDLTTPLPPHLPFYAIYGEADTTVRWRDAKDPAAEEVVVPGGHLTLLVSRHAYRAVALALAAARRTSGARADARRRRGDDEHRRRFRRRIKPRPTPRRAGAHAHPVSGRHAPATP
jgi:triacylglycerol lipase